MTGRPTKLTPELLEKAEAYTKNYTTLIPSVAGLAKYLKVSRSTVYKWADEHKAEDGKCSFSDILGDILVDQEDVLLQGGLSGDMNATIVKLVLGKHGYKDQQETDLRANVETSVPVTFTDPE